MHISTSTFKKYGTVFLLWFLIGLGAFLRTYNGDLFPIDNNDDGLFYVWTGSSLIDDPSHLHSHTIFDSSNTALIWRSQYYDYVPHLRFGMKIVEPWFDHPPLGGILASLPAYFLGYTQVEQLPHMIVRYPALIASIITLLLTFVLARKLFGSKVGFFTLLFLATTPYFVFAHRQSYLENFLTPIFLGSVVSFLSYLDTKKKLFLITSAVLAFLCGWIKIPAFAVPMMLAGWALYKKDRYAVTVFISATIAAVASYVIYGFATSSEFFVSTLANQGVRGMYLSSFVNSFVRPVFYGDFMDGLYILGLLSCFLLLLKKDKTEQEKFFAWFFMCWIVVLFLVSGKFNNSPWYRYPLIPFMSVGLGLFGQQLWEKKSLFMAVVFMLFGFSGFDLAGIEFGSSLLRLVTVALLLPFIALFIFPTQELIKKVTTVTIVILLGIMVTGNILAIKQYPFERCESEPCLLPTKVIIEQN